MAKSSRHENKLRTIDQKQCGIRPSSHDLNKIKRDSKQDLKSFYICTRHSGDLIVELSVQLGSKVGGLRIYGESGAG